MTISNINITYKGYIYVWVSNESNANLDVFFDDLKITHTKGAILQEDHYYPFGLSISALSSTAPLSKPNRFKYFGKEIQTDFDLGWYDYGTRFYDPQYGRFTSIDILADKYSLQTPYAYAVNNPIYFVDENGMGPSPFKKLAQGVVAAFDYLTSKRVSTPDKVMSVIKVVTPVNTANILAKRVYQGESPSTKEVAGAIQEMAEFAAGILTSGEITGAKFADDAIGLAKLADDAGDFRKLSGNIADVASESQKFAFGFGDQAMKLADDIGGSHLMKDANWKQSFNDILNNPQTDLHFSLDNIDGNVWDMVKDPGRSSTNWEMSQLYQNKEAWSRTTFYYKGKTYVGDAIFDVKFN